MNNMQIEKSLVVMEDLACGVGGVKQNRGGQVLDLTKIDVPFTVQALGDLANIDVTVFTYARVGEAEFRYYKDAAAGEASAFGLGKWVQISKQCAEYTIVGLPDAAACKGAIVGLKGAGGLPSPVVYSNGANWMYMNNTLAK